MAKTEELRKVLIEFFTPPNQILTSPGNEILKENIELVVDKLLKRLADMGCGFKIDKELPDIEKCLNSYSEEEADGWFHAMKYIKEAGFTGFESINYKQRSEAER